jgi:glycosyltransferase involved in cell wall biosynthesis
LAIELFCPLWIDYTGKGIEYVIQALPEVVRKFPQIVYLIIGITHPQVKAREGESYRKFLEQLVKELSLERHIVFVNRYLGKEELIKYLVATDIYLTPYLNSQQIVSGTLAYAMRFGKVIVSTPYLYAQELIGKNRGILVNFADSQSIKDALVGLLENPLYFRQIEKNAQEFGAKLKWTEVGKDYAQLFGRVINKKLAPSGGEINLVSQVNHR